MDRISINKRQNGIQISILAQEGGVIYEGMITHKEFAELLTGMHNRNIETRTDTMMNKGSVNSLNQIEKFNEFMGKFFESKDNDNDNENEDVGTLELQSNPLEYNSKPKLCAKFNCGGFALQTLTWFIPKVWKHGRNENFYSVEEVDEFVCDCAQSILEEYNERYRDIERLVEVRDYMEVPAGIEVVGFRAASDSYEDQDTGEEVFEMDDFHFIWRDGNGEWWEKCGWSEVKSLEYEPDDVWSHRYDSQITWFARIAV